MCGIKVYACSYMLIPLPREQNGSEQSNSASHVLQMAGYWAGVARTTVGKRAAHPEHHAEPVREQETSIFLVALDFWTALLRQLTFL